MCRQLGVEKRHTTTYHPQADGTAERSIGAVKQTLRCLLLDRKMEQASQPALLPEVSFLLNSVSNASTKLSPHLLTYGREPRAPKGLASLDVPDTPVTVENYWTRLKETKEALASLARNNRERSSISSKTQYDAGKRDGMFRAGDKVLLRKEVRGPLDCKYEGPYTVLRRVGEDAMISLPGKDKWVHLNRCKLYEGSQLFASSSVLQGEMTSLNEEGEVHTPNFRLKQRQSPKMS